MHTHEPEPTAAPSLPTITSYATRHDGWTGEKMATFCEALAETAVVAEACDAARMGISGAYAARRRNPVFAAAWDAALSIARERLADTLLARSMEGNIEQIYKDGELVGERHVLDNRLGLAILRRLDRLAEMGMAVSTIGQRVAPVPVRPERSRGAPAPAQHAIDWTLAIDALRTGDDDGVAKALALIEGHKVEEVEGPPNPSSQCDDEDDGLDLSGRCWKAGIDDLPGADGEDDSDDIWMTDFPPPAGFSGYQSRSYDDVDDDERYVRACTPDEVAILEAHAKVGREAERAEEEELRDAWFELLRGEAENLRHSGLGSHQSSSLMGALEPGPAFSFDADEGTQAPDQVRGDGEG